jgi:hypothetical protein
VPDNQLYTQEAATIKATGIKTALALSKLRFTKEGLVITQFTTIAQLEANEADFDGYTAGGYTLTAWTGPLKADVGGAVITSPLVNVAYGPAGDPPVTNSIGGWWIEDAAGNVRTAGNFDPPKLLQAVGDGFQFVDQLIEARNPPAPEV